MKILAVDTSSRFGVVGICEDGEPLAQICLRSNESHSARLLPSIDWLLTANSLSLDEIDGFGVVTGPGSFTGLRVGLATIKGLAWSRKKPVAAINSLQLLAQPFSCENGLIVPMTDAKKNRVYGAVYRRSGNRSELETVVEPCDVFAQDLVRNLRGPVILTGDGCRKYESELREIRKDLSFAPAELDVPNGIVLAKMAYEAIFRNQVEDLVNLEPVYLRLSEAEMKTKEANVHPVQK